MHRASNAFTVLQATAAIVATAIIFWSLGLPTFRFAEAANVTTFSNTLSSSAPAAAADHTIAFTTPTGVANGETITVDFSDGPFVVGSVDFTDIDVATSSGEFSLAADCSGSEMASAAFSGTTLTITMCAGDGSLIAANGTTTIEIGTNATNQTLGDQQLTNPAAGSYEINLTAGSVDTGATRVAIVETVTVTASVDTQFTFTVTGVAGGQTVNGETTGGTTTATTIPFGQLEIDTASTAAQDLVVVTNARNGFVVTVEADQQLTSSNGADIDSFRNGNGDTTPTAWEAPSQTLGDEDTYGHWGITSDDDTLTSGLTNPFNVGSGGDRFAAVLTTPTEVFRHTGPSNGTTQGEGTTRVGYKVEVSSLQEAADDYTATLTYVATPVF
ncbi:hypothetical protein KC902_00230 [Candidatus Kaiserbacteria bacterium]|nr:hypothetical protein [Candidatus Kaiserbacteria bacterium]USN88646.1 MAG: hypothetical protein H6780_04125 [Candidatus Nomurabacteria bacterium]